MKFKFKHFLITFFILVFAILTGCNKTKVNPKENPKEEINDVDLTILTINDFHGALENFSKIAYYMDGFDKENTIILSAGDMFQGSAVSNLSKGLDVVNVMNMIGFDAMACGNHEFDWGLDTITSYFKGEKKQASFPLLGCNIIDKTTNKIPEGIKEYQIIEKANLKIGIIGYIGLGLETSIATKMVENYEFVDPIAKIKTICANLRQNENVDVVIALGHDASSITNMKLANLEGDERIDAIVNGHSHAKSSGLLKRGATNQNVPYVQASSSGEAVGNIKLTFSKSEKTVTNASVSTKMILKTSKENAEVKAYVDGIIEKTAPIFEKVIGTARSDFNQGSACVWACDMMKKYAEKMDEQIDVAFTNMGGIRNAALPIKTGEQITVNRIHQLMPFDNTLKIVTIKGKIVKNLVLYDTELKCSSNVSINGASVLVDGVLVDEEKDYRVVVIDYIFDKETYPFLRGENIVATGVLLRDVLIEAVENDELK